VVDHPVAAIRREIERLDPDDDAHAYSVLGRHGASLPVRDVLTANAFIDCLRELTTDREPRVRAAAIGLLGRVPTSLIPVLGLDGCATDKSPAVRRQVVLAIGRRGDETAKERCVIYTSDVDAGVRAGVARSLRGAQSAGCLAALMRLLNDSDTTVVDAAAESLQRTLPEATRGLYDACESTSPATRAGAARVLGALQPADAFVALDRLTRDHVWQVRADAIRALGQLPAPASEHAAHTLATIAVDTTLTRTDRFEAIQCLLGPMLGADLEALAAVARSDPDHALRLVAARILVAHHDKRGVAPLVELLGAEIDAKNDAEDRDFVRSTAEETLRAIDPVGTGRSRVAWKTAIASVEARVASERFEYQPQHLTLFW
jgi:HEAT repeat protein